MILLGKIAVGMAGAALAGVGILCSEGMVQVKVTQKEPEGHHLNVIAPAILCPLVAHFLPRRDLAEASRQIEPWLPVVHAALDGLSDTGDVVLVEVREPGEHVEVVKSGGSIVVDVDDPGETVHVAVPIRAISGTVDQITAATSIPQ